MSNNSFCPCKDYECQFNPVNHDKGCNLCIEDSVKTREIPKCFFIKAKGDIDGVTDWSFEAFAELVLNESK